MSERLPEYVLFDLDGTLLDSLPGIEFSVFAAFAECGLEAVHHDLAPMIGPPIRTILSRVGEIEDEGKLDALERAFRKSYDSEGWRKTVSFPGSTQVLRAMHERGHRLFVVSNKPRHIAMKNLDKEGLSEFFDSIVTRDSRSPAYAGKEEMIRTILGEHRVDPLNCLMAGDTMEDAEAAAAVGIRFAFMSYGYGKVVDSPSIPVAYRLENVAQFLPLMELVCDR